MKRFHYEREGGRFCVRDRRRGSPDHYEVPTGRALALCSCADDAQLIVDALNAAQDAKEQNG